MMEGISVQTFTDVETPTYMKTFSMHGQPAFSPSASKLSLTVAQSSETTVSCEPMY